MNNEERNDYDDPNLSTSTANIITVWIGLMVVFASLFFIVVMFYAKKPTESINPYVLVAIVIQLITGIWFMYKGWSGK